MYVHERLELGATSQQGFQAKRLERQANKCGDKGESFNVVYCIGTGPLLFVFPATHNLTGQDSHIVKEVPDQ